MPIVPDCILMIPEYLGAGGATAANVIALLNFGDEPEGETLQGIAAGWEQVVETYMSNQWAIQGDTQFLFLGTDPPGEEFGGNAGLAGTTSGGALPAQCSICLSTVAGGGRRRKGRIYLPGVSEGTVDDLSNISSTVRTAILDELTNWIANILQPADCTLGVYSRLDGVVRPVSSASISPVIDTQRRRVERLSA